MTTAARLKRYSGPAVLSFGFRPFFLAGAFWAALVMVLWVAMLAGEFTLPTAFAPVEWHVHELIYGYVPAIVAGFLLTAVPNWTKRLPVAGAPLLSLFSIWLVGRLAVLFSFWIGSVTAAFVDLLFLVTLGGIVAREIIAGKNARNLKVLAVLGVLLIGNAIFHLEAQFGGAEGYGMRIGISATLLLILLIGGRIIPSFTRNWLVKQRPGRLPIAFNRVDAAIIVASTLSLVSWVMWPEEMPTAVLALVAGVLNAYRLSRWAGERTVPELLVLVLHVAYAFVALGFLLLALSIWRSDVLSPSGALHGWTAGAISLMTLAVMTRASLGHCGQPLTASGATQSIYLAAVVATIARIAAAFDLATTTMLYISAAAWVAAFAGFVVFYGPLLLRRSN